MKNHLTTLIGFWLVLASPLFAQMENDTIDFANPQKLNDRVNSSAEESLPILSADGSKLFFARTLHPANMGGLNSGQDVWMSDKSENGFTKAVNMDAINSEFNDVIVGIADDGNKLYLLNQIIDRKTINPGISLTEYDKTEETWSAPRFIQIPGLEIKGDFYSAYVSPNEDFILFSLPSEIDSLGNDLFVSTSADNGNSWEPIQSLGYGINSDKDEISPFFDIEKGLLFYSVNKEKDASDYDIYYSKRKGGDWSEWSEPVNAKSLNSNDFDAYFFSNKDGSVYFSSNRNDTLASIYLSEFKLIKILEEDTLEAPVDTAEVVVVPTPTPYSDPVLIIETSTGSVKNRALSSLNKEELTAEDTKIRFVYFDYDMFNITAKYIEVLDDAAELLDRYPELDLTINGHTDSIASQAYNMVLSTNRAASAKEYLVIHGIDPSRVNTKGYGKSQPYVSNETEEGRALNRRVELYFKEP